MIARASDLSSDLSPARRLIVETLRAGRPRLRRSYRQFLEEEFVPYDGPHKGDPFRVANQPALGPLIDAVDDDRWREIVITGPSQSGKTLVGFVGPTAYHLAEQCETVIVGVPDLNMGRDKWKIDLEPSFRNSPTLCEMLPRSGAGSAGGAVDDLVELGNGTRLKMMSPGGNDQRRAGYTGRVMAVTELAGFNRRASTSSEAGPIKQIEARLRGFERAAQRKYLEGTLTIEDEMPASLATDAAVALLRCPCPYCAALIHPEREHLVGWEGAATALEAAEAARFACPECGRLIDEPQRRTAVAQTVMLFDGPDGLTPRPPANIDRLYYRWSSWDNVLVPLGDVAAQEWEAARLDEGTDERDEAERELCQFAWAIPYRPPATDATHLTAHYVRQRRERATPRNVCPDDTEWLTLGVDLGKRNGHYVLIAWRSGGRAVVIDYDLFTVPTASGPNDPGLDVRPAIITALWSLHDKLAAGAPLRSGGVKQLDRAFVDAGYEGPAVYEFMRQAAAAAGSPPTPMSRWLPVLGLGTGQHEQRRYAQPKQRTTNVRVIGERYNLARHKPERCWVVELDADHWKGWLHDRLATPAGQRGALELFDGSEHTHREFARHLTAERAVMKPIPGVGLRRVWVNERRAANHFLDALNYGSVAGHLAGFSVVFDEQERPAAVERPTPGKWWN
jgi:phage terminase large subunit GpA-like protein